MRNVRSTTASWREVEQVGRTVHGEKNKTTRREGVRYRRTAWDVQSYQTGDPSERSQRGDRSEKTGRDLEITRRRGRLRGRGKNRGKAVAGATEN